MTFSPRLLTCGVLLGLAAVLALPAVGQTLTLADGATLRLDAGSTLDLGTATTLVEAGGARLTGGTGVVRATRDLTTPTAVDVAGLGATLTSPAALGLTVVTRGHTPATPDGAPGIARFYDLAPVNNTALDATLVFAYREGELNGLAESTLQLYRSDDGGASYTPVPTTVDSVANLLTTTDLASLARFTAASAAIPALVVTLTPQSPPVEIPPGGGAFGYTVSVVNTTAVPQPYQGYLDAVLPNGSVFGPVLSRSGTLAAGATLGPVTLSQNVPAAAPPGTYAYRATVEAPSSGTVIDQASFPFTKLAAGARGEQTRPLAARETATQRTDPRSTAPQRTAAREGASRGAALREAPGREVASREAPSGVRARRVVAPTAAGAAVATRVADWPLYGTDAFVRAAQAADVRPHLPEATVPATPDVAAAGTALPEAYGLSAPYPNPTARAATIAFALPEAADVTLAVFDLLGRQVALLAERAQPAGWHMVRWDASAASSGVYVVRFVAEGTTGGAHETQRLVVAR